MMNAKVNAIKKSLITFILIFVPYILFGQINSRNRHWAVYYGWPSYVKDNVRGMNANGNVNTAADIFDDYEVVVFNGMVEQTNELTFDSGESNRTRQIIDLLHQRGTTLVYGYITIGGVYTADPPMESTNFLKSMIDDWVNEFDVDGIFADEAGFDYHNNNTEMRARQICVANYAHSKTNSYGRHLKVIFNAWNWDDIYSGTPAVPVTNGDGFCVENWCMEGGPNSETLRDISIENARADALKAIQRNKHQKMYCLAVGAGGNNFNFNQARHDYAFYFALAYDFDYFQYSDYYFSSQNDVLNYYAQDTNNIGNNWTESNVTHLNSNQSNYRSTDTGYIYYTKYGTNVGHGFVVTGPVFNFKEPDGINDNADNSFVIKWDDFDPQHTSIIKFYYATTNTPSASLTFITNIPEDDETDQFTWNTTYLTNDNYYICAIMSRTDTKKTNWSLPINVYHYPPAKPNGLTAKLLSLNSVKLEWKANTEPTLKGYNLYRILNATSFTQKINSSIISNNSYLDEGLSDGIYKYYIEAVDIFGNKSEPSDIVEVETGKYKVLGNEKVKIAPNFVELSKRDYTYIYFKLEKSSDVEIKIYDIYANKKFEDKKNYSDGIHRYKINLNNFQTGVYIVSIRSFEFNKNFKIGVVR